MKVVSGGQTGVDRAALDVAIGLGMDYGGWCPRGGWAEDMPTPPGLLAHYPKLREATSRNPAQRTRWNVRDSDRTLILIDDDGLDRSRGTILTLALANESGKPHLMTNVDAGEAVEAVARWLAAAGLDVVLNVAGPRASTAPRIYPKAKALLLAVFEALPQR